MKHTVVVAVPGDPEMITPLATVRGATVPASALQFEDIYLRYRERIHRYLIRFVGRDAAEDLTQDVFLRVYRALPRLSGDVCLEAWLYRIAINTAYDALRHNRLVSWLALDDLGERPGNDVHDDPQVKYSGSSELLTQVLAQMAPRGRQALLLSLQGYSCAEMGAILGTSQTAAKMWVCRARQQLRQLYQQLLKLEVVA